MKKVSLSLLFFIQCFATFAQYAPQSTGDLLHRLEKFSVLGSVLYVAAHPDDENTMLITWLANEKKVRTGYISLTRGDGGQNLLGVEKDEFAGLLRTEELLAARKTDGGEQFFSRANDFGYCKTTKEALESWGKDQILSDLVYRIRKFKPDVIITRFPPDERAGHGHHSASSHLAELAFDAAADPKVFPEQLKEVAVWQAKRLVWNFYNRGFRNIPPDDSSSYIQVDIGGYNPLLGASYGEIGARARSMHRSQGFGSSLMRGKRMEVLRHTKGVPAQKDLFDDVNTRWARISGGEDIDKAVAKIIADFNSLKPSASVPALLELRKKIESLQYEEFIAHKKLELDRLILDFCGIYGELILADYAYAPGDSIGSTLSIINRSDIPVEVSHIVVSGTDFSQNVSQKLHDNDLTSISVKLKLPDETQITQPYWLWQPHPIGYYLLENEALRGLPHAPVALQAEVQFKILDNVLTLRFPAKFKFVEPSLGEIYRPLEIRPEISLTPNISSLVFNEIKEQEILVTAKSARPQVHATVALKLPAGWSCEPKSRNVNLEKKFDEALLSFKIIPPAVASQGDIEFVATVDKKTYNRGLKSIHYEHIPEITTFPVARVHALKLDLKKEGDRIGYIMGAGDEVPLALEQMGYTVTILTEKDLENELSGFDAILVGVRAYNTQDWLHFAKEKLMSYVKNGGNLICQYQTNGDSEKWIRKMAPYDMSLSRDRVCEEKAEVRFIDPKSPILNEPNSISEADFEGWVQERGLYFASTWDKRFIPVFSINDEGESEKLGSLLHTRHGNGNFVFTGLSFFRQLPAGVPGAYRLMANLISLK